MGQIGVGGAVRGRLDAPSVEEDRIGRDADPVGVTIFLHHGVLEEQETGTCQRPAGRRERDGPRVGAHGEVDPRSSRDRNQPVEVDSDLNRIATLVGVPTGGGGEQTDAAHPRDCVVLRHDVADRQCAYDHERHAASQASNAAATDPRRTGRSVVRIHFVHDWLVWTAAPVKVSHQAAFGRVPIQPRTIVDRHAPESKCYRTVMSIHQFCQHPMPTHSLFTVPPPFSCRPTVHRVARLAGPRAAGDQRSAAQGSGLQTAAPA